MEPYELEVAAAAAAVARRELSPVELLESVLDRIAAVEPMIGAFATVAGETALAAARAAEAELAAGHHRGPLHGIPIGYKDLVDVASLPTTGSSRLPPRPVPDRDSAVAARLRAAGAVTVGKTHTHEFAAGVTTPTTRNPWSTDRVPGGSSGGSAAAIAARECMVAIGTDTGGSIRIPAAFCGVVGLKPTYDLVPRAGVTPLSWSLDHVGPITRGVRDAALVLTAVADGDTDYTANLDRGVAGLRVGVLSAAATGQVDPDIARQVEQTACGLADVGATLTEVDLPEPRATAATSWTLTFVEAATFHRRNLDAHAGCFGADVRTLLEVGQLMPATRYVTALRARGVLRRRWQELFADVDVILGPTVPCTPTRADEHAVRWPDGTVEAAPDAFSRLTLAANVVGLPAISLPVGLTAAGLPVGAQLFAPPFAEPTLLRAAAACEEHAAFSAVARCETVGAR